MSSFIGLLATACLSLLAIANASATERSHISTVKFVYPLASGDFVIGLDTDTTACTSTSSPKYYFVTVGANGVTTEGSKKLYAAALTAITTRQTISLTFDDSTAYCYVNRLTLNN